jgi:hypothetical protein
LRRAHELYTALLGPIEEVIKDKHLLVVPSGPLTSLPFHVLVTEAPRPRFPTMRRSTVRRPGSANVRRSPHSPRWGA